MTEENRRNRAKCKLCESTIESFFATDYVSCTCGQIAVSGGAAMHAFAQNFDNFLRIGDADEPIEVKYKEKGQDDHADIKPDKEPQSKPTRGEMIQMLDTMIASYENLPQSAMFQPTTHSDLLSVLLLVSSLFKSI